MTTSPHVRPTTPPGVVALVATLAVVAGSLSGAPLVRAVTASLPTLSTSHDAAAPARSHAATTGPAFTATAPGTLRVTAAGLQAVVRRSGLEVRTSATASPVTVTGASIGRRQVSSALPQAAPVASDTTATITRGPVVEWVHTRSGALEQGWTVARRPAGTGPLSLGLTITGARVRKTSARALVLGDHIVYDHLLVRDATGAALPAHFATTAHSTRIVVQDAHATYPLVIDPNLTAVATLDGPSNGAGSAFGNAVVTKGRWMVVGEQGARLGEEPTVASGLVNVYFDTTGNGTWSKVQTLSTAGTPFAASSTTGLGGAVGLVVEPAGVTVLARLASQQVILVWTLAGDPVTAAPSATPLFRQSIAVTQWTLPTFSGVGGFATAFDAASDGTLVVGAPLSGGPGVTGFKSATTTGPINETIGTVEVFRRSGGFGTSYGYVTHVDPAGAINLPANQRDAEQLFGTSVAYDPATQVIAVGAPGDDGVRTDDSIYSTWPNGSTSFNGAVDVFTPAGANTWSLAQRITSTSNPAQAKFGNVLSFAGPSDGLVVGAPNESEGAAANSGAAYVFDHAGGTWSQVQRISGDDPSTAANDTVGFAVGAGTAVGASPDGTRIYVGAPNLIRGGNLSTSTTQGEVMVWQRAGETGAASYLTHLDGQSPNDSHGGIAEGFGSVLGISATTAAVGAPSFGEPAGTFVGRVNPFQVAGTSYTPTAELKPDEHTIGDFFGYQIAQDGDVMAVALPNSYRSSGYGLGAVALYDRSGGTWTLEKMMFPDSANYVGANAGYGSSLALHVYRDAGGHDTGVALAIGSPSASVINPGAGGTLAALSVANTGNVGIWTRNGPPGTAFSHGELFSGSQEQTAANPGDTTHAVPNAYFGWSLAFTGDGSLIVGQPGDDNTKGSTIQRYEGSKVAASSWTHQETVVDPTYVSPADQGNNDFGLRVASDGTSVAVESYAADGHAVITRYLDGSGSLTYQSAFDSAVDGTYGTQLVVSGSRIAVSSVIASTTERVGIYRMVGNVAVREALLQPDPGDPGTNHQFGEALDFNHGGSVTTLAVGAAGADCSTSGQAFVYVAQKKADGSATWSRAASLVPPDSLPGVCAGTARTGFGAAISNWPNNGGLLVSAPDAAVKGLDAGRIYQFDGSSLVPPPGPAAFVDVHAPASMQVGADKVSTDGIPPSLLSQNSTSAGSIAAAPLGSIDLSQPSSGSDPESSPLASVPLSAIPVKSIPVKSIPLSSIPVKSIAGGWDTILAGTRFAGTPLASITFGEVYDLPSVQALPLGALQLAGSPLASVPLAAIALGATPVKSIDISPGGADPVTDWCNALSSAGSDPARLGLDCAHPLAASNDAVTMLSLGLQGAPIDALPVKSIPVKSIDTSAWPVRGIALSTIGMATAPVKSIPVKSIDVGATPLASIPVKSIPVKSIPVKSIDLSAVTLSGTPVKSIPVKSIDVNSTPVKSIPVKSIDLSSVPLSSIPVKSIPVKSIPVKSIDLSAIVLAGTPVKSIPLSAIDINSTPVKSIPVKSIDLSSVPLSSIPVKSIPVKSIPVKSIDMAAITLAGTPVKSIPVKSIDLAATPVKSIPVKSIGANELATLIDCTSFDCTAADATVGDAYVAGAIKPGAQLGDYPDLLTGLRLSDLVGAGNGITADQIRAALGNMTLADLSGFDDLTLGELPNVWPYLTLGQIQSLLTGVRLGDISNHLLDFTSDQMQQALANSNLTLANITNWDDVTLGEVAALFDYLTLGDLSAGMAGIRLGDLADAIHKPGGGTYSSDDLQTALAQAFPTLTLGSITDFDDLTLGELGQYGDATIGDLLSALSNDELGKLTLEDLLLSLIAQQQYPWSSLNMTAVGAQALDQHPADSPVTVSYRASAPDGLPRSVQLTVELPAGSRIDPSTIHSTWSGATDESTPVISGDTATWTFTNVPANADQSVTFDLQAPLTIGPATIKATALMPTDDAIATDTANTTVQEALEPNDTTASATPLPDNTIVLSHVSHAGDLDVFKFNVTQPGTRVSLDLSNLDADLDMVLYAPRDGSITPTSGRSLDPVEDSNPTGTPGQNGGVVTQQPAAGDDVEAPVDLGNLAVTQASLNRGHSDEQIDTGVLTRTGTYYVAVSGYNGAVDRAPYALRLKRFQTDTQPACPARQVTPGALGTQLPQTLPVGTNTVFVVDQSRMSGLYGDAAASELMTNLASYSAWLAQHPALGVSPAVLTVDADQDVRDAYAAWDASPCLVTGANGVVSQIARILNGYRQQGTALKNVVIVGGDDAVPFARVPDRTTVANETGYASTFSDAGNSLYATFASSSVQTDNAYVDRSPYAFGDRTLYVPDASIGRLVESPTEISAQLTDFENAGGKLAVNTGLVTGYDFLSDGAQAVAHDASTTYHSVDSHLISDTWTRQQLQDAIAAIKPDLLSINSHFDHFRALPAAGNTSGDESDLFTAAAVRGALNGDLAGSVVFSMGCHSGLSASDLLVPPGDPRALDFAQAVSSQGGVFVGNTGFGYGDTDTVALSEQLMDDFAQRLNGSMTVGEALLYAKNTYFSSLATFTPYDEKVLQEATFYGLPFYQLDVPNPPQQPDLPLPNVVPDPATGLDSASQHIVPTYVNRTADDGTTYVAAKDPQTGADELTTVQDHPVEPKVTDEFAMPAGETSHDALVTGLTSVDNPGTDPYVFQPVVDSSGERQDVGVDTAFPTRPVQVNPGLTPDGESYDVAATTGYFRTTKDDGTGVQRNYHSMDVQTYFTNSNDFTAPTFSHVAAAAHDNTLSVTADVTDDHGGAAGVKRVYLLALVDPRPGVSQAWESIDLLRTAGTDEWTGSLPANGQHIEYIVQAVDEAGNVGVTSDKATNFVATGTTGTSEPAALDVQVTGPQGAAGWFKGTATVAATGGDGLSYEIVGEHDPAAYTGPFTVSGTGLHTVRIVSEDGQQQTVTVRIDTVGPQALLSSPADGQLISPTAGLTVAFTCPDAGSGSTTCTATLDGNPVSNGAVVHPISGTHSVTVTAGPDVAGNAASVPTVTHSFTVVGPPTVGTIGVAKTQDGSPTTITVPFTGNGGLNYAVKVVWGDGVQISCTSTTVGCTLTRNGAGGGTWTVAHTYASSAVNSSITATVTDQLGQSGSGTMLVNRATSLSATAALLQLSLNGGVILKSGSISATLKAGGVALAGQTLKFTLPDGTTICTGTTDANGFVKCPSNLVLTVQMLLAGRYVVTYPGKDLYKGSTTSASLIG